MEGGLEIVAQITQEMFVHRNHLLFVYKEICNLSPCNLYNEIQFNNVK